MDARSPVARALSVGFVALVCLALLAGCVDTSEPTDTPTSTAPGAGPNTGIPVTDYETFVDAVSFENESLVVIQAFPASSVPDYRVESVARDGPTLHVSINDSSGGGTDDVTIETVLVRLPGATPDNVVVTTEEGDTFEIGDDS